MEKEWSKAWKASSQKRKQRKYLFKAPLHIKHKMLSSGLSKDLKKEFGFRSIPVRKGDTVKLISGQFKHKSGKIIRVSLSKLKVYIDGIGIKRADGTLSLYPVNPSNLVIEKLDTNDKKRMEKIERLKQNGKQ